MCKYLLHFAVFFDNDSNKIITWGY